MNVPEFFAAMITLVSTFVSALGIPPDNRPLVIGLVGFLMVIALVCFLGWIKFICLSLFLFFLLLFVYALNSHAEPSSIVCVGIIALFFLVCFSKAKRPRYQKLTFTHKF